MKRRTGVLVGLAALAVVLVVASAVAPVGRPAAIVLLALSAALVFGIIVQVREHVVADRDQVERRAQHRLAALLEYSNDVVVLVDADGVLTYASPGIASALGYPGTAWTGRHLSELLAHDHRSQVTAELDRLVRTGRDATVEFEADLVRRDGARRHGDVVMVNLLGDEAVAGIVVTFRDITDQRDREQRLSHRAFHDELTGLANRALFLERMSQVLDVVDGSVESRPVMVLFIDLDDFKTVNDQFGHAVGDQLLRAIAQRVRAAAGSGDTVARLGGDEFAVLLEDRGGIDRAIDVAERVLDLLARPLQLGDVDAEVLASIGIAVAPPGTSTTSVLRDADIAMYEAKRAGKGQVRIFDPSMRELASRHLSYRSDLASAVAQRQLRVVFLPFVDLRTGAVRGAEALVRWSHPVHGEVGPVEFVPIAERAGLMVPIGRWVLAESLDRVRRWGSDPTLFVSVNLSAPELREDGFVAAVASELATRGLHPRQLVFEVTEDVVMSDPDGNAIVLAELRELGVRIALDDFGTGAMSLGFLRQHPVDLIKLDRDVTRRIQAADDHTGGDLARTIVSMARMFGAGSVAEGIETTSQLRELRSLGCEFGQGHLLSAPLDADVLDRRFSAPTPIAGS